MNIILNGKNESVASSTVADLLDEKGITESVIVEHNHRIVKKSEWHHIRIRENDILEVLRFVGGG